MQYITSINPANNKVIGRVKISSEKEIRNKVAKANKAKTVWGNTSVKERIKILTKAYQAFEKNKLVLAELITKEMGMPKSVRDMIEVDSGLSYFKWYLENAESVLSPEITFQDKNAIHKVFYEPVGGLQ